MESLLCWAGIAGRLTLPSTGARPMPSWPCRKVTASCRMAGPGVDRSGASVHASLFPTCARVAVALFRSWYSTIIDRFLRSSALSVHAMLAAERSLWISSACNVFFSRSAATSFSSASIARRSVASSLFVDLTRTPSATVDRRRGGFTAFRRAPTRPVLLTSLPPPLPSPPPPSGLAAPSPSGVAATTVARRPLAVFCAAAWMRFSRSASSCA
mmetsp:Transcript_24730/g.76490  ORF Transcript_24730/g.76490 Transcript_24730/m.76490 type:complete len:213 (-) Transcript_24730:469-1107(-)